MFELGVYVWRARGGQKRHPKAAKVAKGVMFELGVYFGARGVAKNGPLRPPRLKSMYFYVFSAPGGPKVRTRPKRGLKQNENSCFEHFLGVGIFRIFSGPGGVDFAKSALFASRGPQTS